jgi:hypothetical protein
MNYKVIFTTCKETSNIWIQVSQYKIIFKCILWRWNFRKFIRFLQKDLNPLKIQVRFNFEFVPEFITGNPEGFCSGAKKEICSLLSLWSPQKDSSFLDNSMIMFVNFEVGALEKWIKLKGTDASTCSYRAALSDPATCADSHHCYPLSAECKALLAFLLLARFSATPLHFPSTPSRPASFPPHSAPVPPLLYAPRHSSSHRLPWRHVLFSAPPVAIRERPAVDPSRPQASTPTPSAFHREHLNAASRFRPPSGPDIAATSFVLSTRTSSAHHPRRTVVRSATPHVLSSSPRERLHADGPPPAGSALASTSMSSASVPCTSPTTLATPRPLVRAAATGSPPLERLCRGWPPPVSLLPGWPLNPVHRVALELLAASPTHLVAGKPEPAGPPPALPQLRLGGALSCSCGLGRNPILGQSQAKLDRPVLAQVQSSFFHLTFDLIWIIQIDPNRPKFIGNWINSLKL